MTTARDFETARALAEKLHPPSAWGTLDMNATNAVRDWMAELIAAALSERERETVELCCRAVCSMCKNNQPIEIREGEGDNIYWHTSNWFAEGGWCAALSIRADAARRETP